MHFCKAMIAIGNDDGNIYFADQYAPISWPEIQVLQHIHGIDAVRSAEPFVFVNQDARSERDRLAHKYGEAKVSEVFGGQRLPTELTAPRASIAYDTEWKNPITALHEMVPPGPVKVAAAIEAKEKK